MNWTPRFLIGTSAWDDAKMNGRHSGQSDNRALLSTIRASQLLPCMRAHARVVGNVEKNLVPGTGMAATSASTSHQGIDRYFLR